MVPAPGFFSTMTVKPRSFAMSCASVRATTSVPPPGAKGTTSRTILSGYRAIAASVEITAIDNAANASSKERILLLSSKGMRLRTGIYENAMTDFHVQPLPCAGRLQAGFGMHARIGTRGLAVD